jgi:hypothetical protein
VKGPATVGEEELNHGVVEEEVSDRALVEGWAVEVEAASYRVGLARLQ